MLQQILKDMYIDPDVLEALSEEQKKILFLKMRQEQVRRWKEREDRMEKEGVRSTKPKKAHSKSVTWLLGHDGDVHVCVIGEADEQKPSKFIFSGLGGRMTSGLHNNSRSQTDTLKSTLVNRPSCEAARPGRENLPPKTQTGIQLKLKDNSEDLKSGTLLPPLQLAERSLQSSPAAEIKESPDSGNLQDSSKDLSVCHRPLNRSSAPLITGKLSTLDPQGRRIIPLSITKSLPPQDLLDQQSDKAAGRGFRLVAASRRMGAELDGEGGQGVARGRVAQLMKNFNGPNGTHAPPCSKPPVPTKPAHLQVHASPSLR
ncbi:SH2 domain-containing protein 4A [Megalops cyprinoides]|uniref:SH2 domain-containing protein 4A n=1 Tax=Megalops cyprinoides TaxID=118141 RepID=UPI001864E76C|nr:SH2 domain-containing protein 4A [Megalops cyprinoides]